MNSQIRFFMAKSDEEEFIEWLKEGCGELDQSSDAEWLLDVDGEQIQVLPCERGRGLITIGRVAVRTDKPNVARVFRRIQSWIKKNYVNNLTCRNTMIEGSAGPVKGAWVGPSAKAMAESRGTKLIQSKGGCIVYEFPG